MVRQLIFLCFLPFVLFGQLRDLQQQAGTNQFPGSFEQDSVVFEEDEDAIEYDFSSSQFSTAEDLRYNLFSWNQIDTSLNNRHQYTIPQQNQYTYHNLGNIGSPVNTILYHAPDVIGARSGFNTFDPYFDQNIRFFDSKAPLTKLGVILGGNGRSKVDVEFSRNVNPRWNVFTQYKNITADKQIGANRSRGDRQTASTYYHFGTYYKSQNEKYQALTYFKRINHVFNEVGGLTADSSTIDFTDQERAEVLLQNTRSREFRYRYQLYHQYKFSDFIEVFNTINLTRQERHFNITNNAVARLFENPLIIEDSTVDQTNFNSQSIDIGIKGDYSGFFYFLYGKLRRWAVDYKYLDHDTGYEAYVGGKLRFTFREVNAVEAGLDYLFFDRYNLYGSVKSRWFDASVRSMIYSPGLIEQRYLGNFSYWQNDFNAVSLNEIKGQAKVDIGRQRIRPTILLSNIFQPVYFDENLRPVQASGAVQFVSPGVDIHLAFNGFNTKIWGMYNLLSGAAADAFRTPDFFGFFQVYYEDIWFNNSLEIQFGLEGNYKAPYLADAYNPALQTFYLQNERLVEDFLNVDFFMNFKIQDAICFFKITNLSQIATGRGYFVTPRYPVQATAFDFGVEWYLFN